jgi:hypothetical protein
MSVRRALAAVLIASLAFLDLSACGHQVTPERVTSILSGDVVIRFRTKNPMDFSKVAYEIIFNTCAPGGEPYPNAYTTGYTSYSYAFVVGGTGTVALPILFQYILTSNQLVQQSVALQPSSVQLTLNDNGLGTEFRLTFPRAQLSNPLAQPNTGCPPNTTFTNAWFVNFFSIDTTTNPFRVLDSLGLGGSNDSSFTLQVDTTTQFQTQITRPPGSTLPSNPAAQIDGGEIDNYL